VVGIALFVGGAVSFIGGFDREPSFPHFPDGSFGGRRGSPSSDDGNKFWMCFVGVPVLGIGAFLTKAGYFGAAARYIASESRPAVHTITRAVAEGLRGDDGDAVGTDGRGGVAAGGEAACAIACPSCDAENDADARFCDACGQALARTCPECGDVADADARFCDECGTPLA